VIAKTSSLRKYVERVLVVKACLCRWSVARAMSGRQGSCRIKFGSTNKGDSGRPGGKVSRDRARTGEDEDRIQGENP